MRRVSLNCVFSVTMPAKSEWPVPAAGVKLGGGGVLPVRVACARHRAGLDRVRLVDDRAGDGVDEVMHADRGAVLCAADVQHVVGQLRGGGAGVDDQARGRGTS